MGLLATKSCLIRHIGSCKNRYFRIRSNIHASYRSIYIVQDKFSFKYKCLTARTRFSSSQLSNNASGINKTPLSVQEALQTKSLDKTDVCIRGWIKSLRIQKKYTFIDLIDGLSPHRLQVIAHTKNVPDRLSFHSAVCIKGVLVKSDHKGQDIELHATTVDLINATSLGDNKDVEIGSNVIAKKENKLNNQLKHHRDGKKNNKEGDSETILQTTYSTEVNEPKDVNDIYPFAPRKRYPENFCRTYPEYRSKLPDFGCLLRIRSTASHAVHDFFLKRFSSKF